MLRRSILAVVLTSVFAVSAFAQTSGGGKQGAKGGNHPCREDVQKLCPEVKPGEGRIIACLKAHQAALSAQCQEKLSTLQPNASDENN